MHFLTILHALILLLVVRLLVFIYQAWSSPLCNVPGPFAARFSKFWFFNNVRLGYFELENIRLHRKYGSVVRIASDHYSIDDPTAVKIMYGIGTKFPKSDWYEGWKHPSPERWTLFPDRDMKRHAETRKHFQALYSMTSLVSYETFVDDCASIFESRLREIAESGETINMGHWFQCYAFDVIACITFGERFGFLDHGEDIDGIMVALNRTMKYSTLIGIFPRMHPLLFNTAAKFPWSGAQGRIYIMNFVQKQIERRRTERKLRAEQNGKSQAKEHDEGGPEDFLEKMMNASEDDASKITPYHIFMMGLSNIIAGSDTTAISLSAILYYLLKNPETMRKLKQEITEFERRGQSSNPEITFKESQAMPYLQAVMKESLRLHPATGLPLWRVVPKGGAEISQRYFPAGSVVGINTWCAHHNEDVFGENGSEFQPERWIVAEREDPLRLKRMDAYYMPFGLGSRTCLGRHISFLEMSKLIPRLIRDFDFELNRPDEIWNTENYWFVKPTNFKVRVKLAKRA